MNSSLTSNLGRWWTVLFVVVLCGEAPLFAQTLSADNERTVASEPRITLIEAGEEPRVELRFRPAKEARSEFELLVASKPALGADQGVVLPLIRTVMLEHIENVAENGDITLTMTTIKADALDTPGVAPDMLAQMRAGLKMTERMVVRGVLSARGESKEGNVEFPDDVHPALAERLKASAQSIDQLASPLPLEPVGVGAVWKLETTRKISDSVFKQVAQYTLVSMDGNVIEVSVKFEQVGAPRDRSNAGSVRVVSMKATGEGRMTLNLSKVIAERLEMTTRAENVFMMTVNGEDRRIEDHSETEMRLKPVEKIAPKASE